jgi:predicted phosphodiesterase
MQEYKFRNDTCILLGDTHSLEETKNIIGLRVPDGMDIIHMGDAALGFGNISYSVQNTLTWLGVYNKLCEELNVNLYIIRGNHDATYPSIWDSQWSNVFLIRDHAYGTFPNGKTALIVGGGLSVDRVIRKSNIDYWEDEYTVPIESVKKCDILFSHDCPEHFNHSTQSLPKHYGWYCDRDPELLSDCLKQRLVISDIAKNADVNTIFSGHFHNDIRQYINGVYYRCLDINELFEFDSTREYKL